MPKSLFIAGTDTEVGKTFISLALLKQWQTMGLQTIAMKPVAAGCDEQGQNEDALALMQAMTIKQAYAQVNPVALKEPIAPHIAAAKHNKRITVSRLVGFARGLMLQKHDAFLIEGAGGWLCPLNNKETLADLAASLNMPVVLVVGMRLGCLNHALLTAQSIAQAGLPLAGWVANIIEPDMPELAQNIHFLKQRLAAPCLGVVPQVNSVEQAATYLTTDILFA